MIGRRTPSTGRLVVAFYLSFLTLVASGRLGSVDAGAQLQAATRLVTAGELGTDRLPPTGAPGWQVAPNGRYYEPHDLGNILLMTPAAWLGHAVSGSTPEADFAAPPVASRAAVSLTYAVVNAVTCICLFQLFALWRSPRQAFLLSLAFAATTMFLPYAKTAWDVLGACCGVSALLWAEARIMVGRRQPRDVAAAAVAFVLACAFRYSLAPFLALSLAGLWYAMRQEIRARQAALFAIVAAIGFIPSFVFNQTRTGQFWRPGTATAAYLSTNNALNGNIVHGALGLLAAPNRGLLAAAPIFVLLLALPFGWRRVSREERTLFGWMAAGAACYWLALAALRNWSGAVSWGPRYLVPILPILFVGVALALVSLWARWKRALIVLIAVSALANIPPATVNWSVAILTYPRALAQDALVPYQQLAAWRALGRGLAGQAPEVPAPLARDPVRLAGARFPDFWTARLMQRSRLEAALGGIVTVVLLALAGGTCRQILRRRADEESTCASARTARPAIDRSASTFSASPRGRPPA